MNRTLVHILLATALVATPVLAKGHSKPNTDAATHDTVWVRTAGASSRNIDPAKAPTLTNATVRETIRITRGGTSFRVTLSNEHGTTPLKLGAATLSYKTGDAVRFIPLTFSGKPGITIAAGAPTVSDVIAVPLADMQAVDISLYFPETAIMSTFHSDVKNLAVLSTAGDFTQSPEMPTASTTRQRPYLAGIEVQAPARTQTIVAFGDSITDADCPVGPDLCRWSDVLADRLLKAGKLYSVANEAISGNRILLDTTGFSALARFNRDVLSQPNVGYVVMLEGINDIGNSGPGMNGAPDNPPLTAEDLIAGYKQIIARAHEHGIKVYGAEILPFKGAKYASDDKDKIRLAVNDWIRTGGAFDGLVDFASAVADPKDPDQLNPDLSNTDHLHPNPAGQRAMGMAIDLNLFK